ncbi:Maf family protein [Marinomonas epiphytica]
MQKKLILASSSSYRKTLLKRLHLAFQCRSPEIDETPKETETASQLVRRLSFAKAHAVSTESPNNSVIIASDQVASLAEEILGKPLTKEKAYQQLSRFSGKQVDFITGLCVYDKSTNTAQYHESQYSVFFRQLSQQEIIKYIELESPLDCAGSFKCEGLGVCLFEKMAGDDPNSLIGLPLIKLAEILREHQINPLTATELPAT